MQTTARTEDTAGYYEGLKDLHVAPLWQLPETTQAAQPAPCAAYLWRWADLYPQLRRAVDVVDLESGAERRVLTMLNPGMAGAGATHTLTTSLQLIMPGEVAPAHRHTPSALRFIIQGEGGYTVVEGEKLPMVRGDLILTPNWTWHDHGSEGTEPVVWLDGLDVPFVRALGASFFQDYPGRQPQVQKRAVAESYARYGGGGLVAGKDRPTTLWSPLNLYKWEDAYEALKRLQATGERDEFDGTILRYVNPLTGGHVLPTIGCYLQALEPGERTRAHRHTACTVLFVAQGSGHTIVNGERFDWSRNDILAIPPWQWHEHAADAGEEAILFMQNDLPVLEPFGLVREEAYKDNGGHQAPG